MQHEARHGSSFRAGPLAGGCRGRNCLPDAATALLLPAHDREHLAEGRG
jgi:hypothetical protein